MQIDFVFSRCNFGVCLPPFYRNRASVLVVNGERQSAGRKFLRTLSGISGSMNLVAEPMFCISWFSGLRYSAATFRTSRSSIVAGASLTRLLLRLSFPSTKTS
jgi:hypothetical protein